MREVDDSRNHGEGYRVEDGKNINGCVVWTLAAKIDLAAFYSIFYPIFLIRTIING